jgi:hypothetical protein
MAPELLSEKHIMVTEKVMESSIHKIFKRVMEYFFPSTIFMRVKHFAAD